MTVVKVTVVIFVTLVIVTVATVAVGTVVIATYFSKNNLTPQQQMRYSQGSFSRFSTTHQSAGLRNRVQLQLSRSKFTADHALATGQSWPLLLCHSEKMFLTVKVICSDLC